MNAPPKIDMAEATRLTREGRLDEAMAVLRGARAPAADTRTSDARVVAFVHDVSRPGPHAPALPVLDLLPPSTGPGGAWAAAADAVPAARASSAAQAPAIADLLRGLLQRVDVGPLPSGPGSHAKRGRARPGTHPAPAPVPDGARFEHHDYTNAAGSRTYKLYVPRGYHGQPLPLVVMLHGCTQSPDDFAAGTRMNELAEQHTFLVAYPAQAQAANASRCWNWFSAGDQQRDVGEPSLIAGITRQILRDYPVQSGRVYVAGLSAGGAAAAIMGATYPDLYAAIGVHSGLACGAASDMPSAFTAMRQGGAPPAARGGRPGGASGGSSGGGGETSQAIPTIVFHGDRDTTVSPVNGDHVITQSRAAAPLQTSTSRGQAPGGMGYTRTVHSDERGQPMLEHWLLHGAGHAWSGGSPAGSYTEPRGPDASAEMLRFFLQHPAAPVG